MSNLGNGIEVIHAPICRNGMKIYIPSLMKEDYYQDFYKFAKVQTFIRIETFKSL
jgi:hypothetical protein